MVKLLPFIFLISFASLFGISWIIFDVDPQTAPIYVFGLLVFLIFLSVLGFLGVVLYFLRIRLYKRYSPKWYFYTSFKMAFFVAVFAAIISALAIFQLVSIFNLFLVLLALILFALWSFLGKNKSN